MTWKTIRLELARTERFPQGSASRSYLLRLPVGDDGLVDETTVKETPARATFRRFWPNEPDRIGYVVRTPKGWALSYEPGEADDEQVYHLESHPLRIGEYVTLTEPDGARLPFRVAHLQPSA